MTRDLTPKDAAALALGVYSVSDGDERDLQIFMGAEFFKRSSSGKQLLSTELGGRIVRSAKDVFGICAKGRGLYEGDLILAFRGTTTANNHADYFTDARVGLEPSRTGWPVHIGFNHAFTAMLPELRKCLSEWKPTGVIHCVGHSLGGAVATLAADWAASATSRSVKLYTFGQPRVGLTMFSRSLTRKLGAKNIHRVFHTTDPVPMVPVFPYVHSPLPGWGLRILSEEPILSGEAHRMSAYEKSVKDRGWCDLVQAPPIHSHEAAIKAWLKSYSYVNPGSPKAFVWLEHALIWLISKKLSGLAYGVQWTMMGIHTFLDKVAWLLLKGISVGEECAEYVTLFLRKVSQILGMTIPAATSLTHSFLRFLLETLTKRASELALKAIRGLRNWS